jgi:hypothetical protein
MIVGNGEEEMANRSGDTANKRCVGFPAVDDSAATLCASFAHGYALSKKEHINVLKVRQFANQSTSENGARDKLERRM